MGVSNTAGTLNYFIDMDKYFKNIANYVCLALFAFLSITVIAIVARLLTTNINISSPVEEMYHRQLVTTLDSILDARFGAGCCDNDSIE